MWTLILWACAQNPADEQKPEAPRPRPVEAPAPLPDPTDERYAASRILVSWKGAVQAPPAVQRTEAEAEALAKKLRVRAQNEDFGDLASAHSDDPSGKRGGRLGVYPTGTMVPDFERAVAATPIGALGPLVRTPFGWHIVRRDAITELIARHILITHTGSLRPHATRSREQARALIDSAKAKLDAGQSFADVAKSMSEDEVANKGGLLGRIAPGQMVPPFEDAAFALAPGAVSEVVETTYGFHIIRRELP